MSPLRRTTAFVIVAAIGFVLQAAVLTSLTFAGVHVTPATFIAVLTAVVHNFFWHERWTWSDRGRRGALPERLVRYAAGTGMVSLVGTVALTTWYVWFLALPVLASHLLAVWSVGIANYLLLDRVIFEEVR